MQNTEVKRCSIFPVNDRYFLLIYILAETLPTVRHNVRTDCMCCFSDGIQRSRRIILRTHR